MSYEGYETIEVDIEDGVGVVSFNRPEKRNAMNPALHREMTDVLDRIRYDDDVRVLVVTGKGESFSAGMDLKEFFMDLRDKPAEYDYVTRISVEWRGRTLRHFPKPTIAMVNGHCFGGAFTIVEACDLATAAEDARLGLSEINFKMFPGGSVSKSLGNLFRPRDYLWYALTGEPFDGKRAAEMGFVNRAYPRRTLRKETLAIAKKIAEKDPSALRATKDAYRFSLQMDWDAAMNYTSAMEGWHVQRQSDAFREEGIGDFLDKKYKPGLGGPGRARTAAKRGGRATKGRRTSKARK